MITPSTPDAQIFTTMCPPSKLKERLDSVIVPNQTTKTQTQPPPSPSNENSTLLPPTTTNYTHKFTTILPPSASNIHTILTMSLQRTPKEWQQYDDDGAQILKANDEEVEVLFDYRAVVY